MNAAIAHHLNIAESAIVRVEEWASVLFVVCRKLGARFVSKKVVAMGKAQKMAEVQSWLQEKIDRKNAPDAPVSRVERLTKAIEKLEHNISVLQEIDESDRFWSEVESLTPAVIFDWQFGYRGQYASLFK